MKIDTEKLASSYKVKIASKKTHIKNETERLKELEFILELINEYNNHHNK